MMYVLLVPFLFIFSRGQLKYNLVSDNFALVFAITLSTLFIFLFFVFRKFGVPRFDVFRVLPAVLYGIAFAFPEEIIFRGVVQNLLQIYFGGLFLTVLFSSVVFGLAHLPNGAKCLNPKEWNWNFVALTFAAGIPLGLIFALTKSLLIPTLLHAFFVACLQMLKKDSM